jgi:hypothetical protein
VSFAWDILISATCMIYLDVNAYFSYVGAFSDFGSWLTLLVVVAYVRGVSRRLYDNACVVVIGLWCFVVSFEFWRLRFF